MPYDSPYPTSDLPPYDPSGTESPGGPGHQDADGGIGAYDPATHGSSGGPLSSFLGAHVNVDIAPHATPDAAGAYDPAVHGAAEAPGHGNAAEPTHNDSVVHTAPDGTAHSNATAAENSQEPRTPKSP